MAVVKTWEVNTCERDLSDGYITKVIYRLKATEDKVEIEGTRMTGEVTFTKPSSLPSDFIPYVQGEIDKDGNVTKAGTPNAATVLGWVKAKIDADASVEDGNPSVAQIETTMDNAVALVKTPVTATGVPW